MAIQYDDGTHGPIGPAEDVAEQLRKHFAGEERLEKEPRRALFAESAEDVRQELEKDAGDLEARVAALERLARIEARGIVETPTPEEVRTLALTDPEAPDG